MADPETRYARSGDVSIAYQVVGDGPFDLVFVPGFVSNIELTWRIPERAAYLHRLASFSRLILFDKRGTGMSDRVAPRRASRHVWTTYEPSWMPPARRVPQSLAYRKGGR